MRIVTVVDFGGRPIKRWENPPSNFPVENAARFAKTDGEPARAAASGDESKRE